MNDAHLHMVVNHFPIIGIILGFGVLIAGIVFKNDSVKNTAYSLFIVGAIFAALSMATGEGAEEIVEDMPSVGKKIIHEHEEMAEKLAIVLYLLGVVSIAGLYTNIKKHSQAKLVSFLVLTIAVIGVFLGKQTGTTGGEVRHTEIRVNAGTSSDTIQNEEEGDENEE
ncbi:MAG: hypothetical protein ACOVQC_07765 [Flavobacterium sp.]